MEPMKRMSITVAVILILAVLALGVVYMMAKKLGQRVEMKSVYEETGESPPQEKVLLESPSVRESLHDSETPAQKSATAESQAVEKSLEGSDAKESIQQGPSSPAESCDRIPPEDISKYLQVKDAVFAVYDKNKVLADMMLNQERKWSPDHITNHMWILMEFKIEKKKALKAAELAEKRYHLISNALMEWILRTNEVTYEKKYVGEEDFYRKKIDPIVPCEENDQLFIKNKESILKTFMGDFELVDY